MPTYKAHISAVDTPFSYDASSRNVRVNLQIILDESETDFIEIPILSFPISITNVSFFGGIEFRNCLSSFAKLYNLMLLLNIKSRDPHELKGKEVYIMVGSQGYALSDETKEKWVICNLDVPTVLGLSGLVSYEEASDMIDELPF